MLVERVARERLWKRFDLDDLEITLLCYSSACLPKKADFTSSLSSTYLLVIQASLGLSGFDELPARNIDTREDGNGSNVDLWSFR